MEKLLFKRLKMSILKIFESVDSSELEEKEQNT